MSNCEISCFLYSLKMPFVSNDSNQKCEQDHIIPSEAWRDLAVTSNPSKPSKIKSILNNDSWMERGVFFFWKSAVLQELMFLSHLRSRIGKRNNKMQKTSRIPSITKQTNQEFCQDVTQAIKQGKHSCLNLIVCLFVHLKLELELVDLCTVYKIKKSLLEHFFLHRK